MVLVGITIWYVTINNKLLKVQVEPVVELSIDLANQILSLENCGFDDVVTVRVDVVSFSGTRTSSGRLWLLPALKAGQKETRSIRTEVSILGRNLHAMQTWPARDPKVYNHAVVVFQATYFREPDHRRYSTSTRIILLTTPDGYQLVSPAVGIFSDILNQERPFPESISDPMLAEFDNKGNPIKPKSDEKNGPSASE
jgi:hypothetical protein